MPLTPLQRHDRRLAHGCGWLVGVDEAGRGAWAGPVVAAAVALPCAVLRERPFLRATAGVKDSKQVKSPAAREELRAALEACGGIAFAVGEGSVAEIEAVNVLGATKLAMARALAGLGVDLAQARLLIDGRPLCDFPYRHTGIVKGDATSLCIAMASIFAKTTRDRLLVALGAAHPGFGFERHFGYGTPQHRAATRALGPCAAHRLSFRGVAAEQQELAL